MGYDNEKKIEYTANELDSNSDDLLTAKSDIKKNETFINHQENINRPSSILSPTSPLPPNEDTDDVDIVNKLASMTDDPTLPVFTLRSIILGVILSCISASVSQLMIFKPVNTPLSTTCLLMIAYAICKLMEKVIPQGGWLNPCPLNHKEMACIYVMVSSANTSAYGTYILGAQYLYYNDAPSAFGSIAFLIATQCVGYGIAGQLRRFIVYPANMIWPNVLPTIAFIRTLNSENQGFSLRTKIFFMTFFCIFIYEFIPQYMFPLLSGISIFCIANRGSIWFQRLFGGLAVNEGLGILQLSFDWNYLSHHSPLVLPLYVQLNIIGGIFILYILAPLLYYYNVWHAQSFPFLSNSLFTLNETTGESKHYPQKEILNPDNTVNVTKLEEIGHPHFSTYGAVAYIFYNFAVTASITHVALYYGKEILQTLKSTRANVAAHLDDIHIRLMAVYKEVPTWWYYILFVLGIALNIAVAYTNESQLPWWGVIVAVLVSLVFSLPLNIIEAVTGRDIGLNVLAELIGGLLFPHKPVANMYFKTLGYNTLSQAGRMASDLKIGHYMKVPPRLTFFHQIVGTIIGCLFNYLVNITVITAQKDVLLDPTTKSNVWNGAYFQGKNSAAITWGGVGPVAMFGPGTQYSIILWSFLIGFLIPIPCWLLHKRYPKVGFNYIHTPMIISGLAIVPGSATAYITVSLLITLLSQWYLRRYYYRRFVKYNYLISTALDSGTSLAVFIISFALMGGGDGKARPFPIWWGNRTDAKYVDYCCMDCN
ncbi:OPT family small oligopeptide transporter [Cunninghamella echinulata]|nr:OPT family small oligopeptide transporter [Cunninghamella echinulata]